MWSLSRHALALVPGLCLCLCVPFLSADEPARPFSFERDVGAVLTRYGCNASECHGGVKGRGGFKLSLGGLYPEQDYYWITRGGDYQVLTDEPGGEQVPRIDFKDPERSLLLLKPTAEVDHEGGERFEKGSPAHEVLFRWIRRGAPYTEEKAENFHIEELEVQPSEVVAASGEATAVRVTGVLADGEREEINDEVHFEIANERVATVDLDGNVTGIEIGETDLLIRAAGKLASVRVGVVAPLAGSFPDVPHVNFIDEHIFAKLRRFQIRPSELSSDAEFLRRVCLDLTGTLPPPSRVREFLSGGDPRKREKIIERLLDSPEYIDYWTFRFADLFRVTDPLYWSWLRDSIARNLPYDEMATLRIAAVGADGPAKFHRTKVEPVAELVAEDMRLFLGRRLDCAQCHDHPWDTWSQSEFWGMAAFYADLTSTEWIDNQVLYDDPNGQEVDWGVDSVETLRYFQPIHPRTGELAEATFFADRQEVKVGSGSPRQQLAELVTAHPYFAEAIVNRIWSCFFHRGFVEPVDHFSSVNPPSHPRLLAALAGDFRDNGHDLKRLIRTIVTSRTYQLSATPNESNVSDEFNFSHSGPRPLVAEVLFDAISQVVGVPVQFKNPRQGTVAPPGRRAIQLKLPAKWSSHFLEIYNRPFRRALPERGEEPTLQQAMHILVGDKYVGSLSVSGSRLDKSFSGGSSNRDILDELYLAALGRFPSKEEANAIVARLAASTPPVGNNALTQTDPRREALEDLLWAILCSREFAYNH